MRTRLAALLCVLALTLSLSACGARPEPLNTTVFAMDTVMELSVYPLKNDDGVKEIFNLGVERLYDYEGLFSATRAGSDVHNLNASGGKPTEISGETAELLARALELCEQTGGALDITAYPAVGAWGFTTGEHRVPDAGELTALAERIDYAKVEQEGQTVTLPAGMELDLGAVAKGYAGDVLARSFREVGVTSALLNLGQSTIAAIGAKPDGSGWRIGIQDPAGTDFLGILTLEDKAMGSSGNYQRFFEENGVIYGHIIDPDTAAPADSGLAGVTVVADSALLCDGLSTALFVMGLEDAGRYWAEHRDFEAIFIAEDGSITITAGLKDAFSLAEGYQDREVTVLE